VLRFRPERQATGLVSLTLVGGTVSDEWGNTNRARSVNFTNSGPVGTVHFEAQPAVDTSPVPLARSEIGSPFLFHGQYFDYDSGLIYLRARYYDPYSGMFFQPDPLGYEDSVNHYAGLGNNPVSYRDPSGLRIKGVTDAGYHAYLSKMGYLAGEMRLLTASYKTLSKLGMGDLEIAAHVRVMYEEYHHHNRSWEIAIRSFGDKANVRIDRIDEFHQTKEEKVVVKTRADGLAYHEDKYGRETGEKFAGDLDGLYAKLNGQIATIHDLTQFQHKVNAEVKRLSDGWRDLAREGGQTIHGSAPQKAYQHGFSLNIPQEFGTKHRLSKGGFFGYDAIEMINVKMTKGIGEAFSFKFDGDQMHINEHVDVDRAVQEHEDYYQNTLFKPGADGFNLGLFIQRIRQIHRDGRVHGKWFPDPFYIKNNK
jgi:RHS repeat-associated protein